VVRLRVLDEVTWDGRPVPGERTHVLLRALVDAGARGRGEQSLVEEIWSDALPANPAKALQVVVSRARSATTTEAIERTATGYRLALADADVDAWSLRPDALRLASEGRYAEALPLLARLQADDDEAVEATIRATAAVAGTPAALDAFETYRAGLADRLGIDPSPKLQQLHQELLARDAPVRAGLRFDADEMIGREADVAALTSLVRTHRLVSIVGAGGLGKTRLAHLMGRIAEQPVVHFVELVSVTSDDGVALEVADALGARESVANRRSQRASQRTDAIGRIVDLIGSVPSLLVLDNCEQVVEGVADLVSALLARTPALTVLTTTRIPLGLAAERTYLLPELSTADAAALFVERAQAARPGAVLEPERVRALVGRLDGLPLAVELAAAKVRVMSVPEIERRLENRFALLRGGARDAPERHQTLLAVIDWSWNLLTEPERIALRRLSVFRDGFSLDGASAVLTYDALDVVTGLVEQSLVVVTEGESLRYRLLETVREFGRMQLVDAGDDVEAVARLRGWALMLCRVARARLSSPDQVATMALLRSEEGNLVEALRRAADARDAEAAATLLSALIGFWTVEGSHLKVLNLAVPMLPVLAAGDVPPEAEDTLRAALASILFTGLIFSGATSMGAGFDRLRLLGADSPDPRTRAIVTGVLALRDTDEEEQFAVLDRLSRAGDRHLAQWSSILASQAAENAGALTRAVAMAEHALTLCDPSDGPWYEGLINAQLAGLLLQQGERAKAKEYASAALPIMVEVGAVEDWMQTRAALALIAMTEGDVAEAERIFEELAGDERSESVFGGVISQLCGRAELLIAQGRIDEGLASYRAGAARLADLPFPALGLELDGVEPWILFPRAASVAAHCRFGRREEASPDHDVLVAKLVALFESDATLDHPLVGSALFALAAWEATGGAVELAARIVALAAEFSINQMLPSLDPAWLEPMLATPVRYDGEPRPAHVLRDEARLLLESL
jgi:predicted ATPase/tetratricopeptide (TPR) repeat protein